MQPETAERVRHAIEQLGLTVRQNQKRERRNSGGSELKNIGVISICREYRSWFGDPVIAALIAEITRAASNRKSGVVLAEMPDPHKLCSVIEEKQIDGALLLIPSEIEANSAAIISERFPCVRVMGAHFGPAQMDHVACDHTAIGYLAAKYLIGKGCRKLAFATQHAEWPLSQMRACGFFHAADAIREPSAVEEARAYFTTPLAPVDNSYGGMSVVGADWPDLMKKFVEHKPDGLFVSREAELGLFYRLLAANNLVPNRDIQVISCDNCDSWLNHLEHRPATIDLCLPEIARTAVSRLEMRVNNPNEPLARILVNPRLIVPESHLHD